MMKMCVKKSIKQLHRSSTERMWYCTFPEGEALQ